MRPEKKTASVREAFVNEIESRILTGELRIGDKLPTARELCTTMGVSLTTVNTGIRQLEADGFVIIKPRHGCYVADYLCNGNPATLFALISFHGGRLSADEVRSFCETRIAIDPMVAELVIKRADRAQLESLGAVLEKLLAAEQTEAVCDYVTQFFSGLYRLSGNSLMALIYNSTIPHQKLMYRTYIEKNGTGQVKENAEQVYKYITEGDAESAKRCLIDVMHLPLEGPTAII